MKEQLLFFVDPNVNADLREIVKKAAQSAEVIHGVESVYADTEPDKYPSSRFTVAGKYLGDKEFGEQRDADMMLKEIERLLGEEGRHVVFITYSDITVKSRGEYLCYCYEATDFTNIIISVRRLRNLPVIEQKIFLSDLIMHEIRTLLSDQYIRK
ncbi:hypothetical protein IKE98_00520 [Candidatus Saccharibacteria bacterium]|nr:hypothetical protein [Candidatus Saccharibacteria bacterium]